LPVVFIACGVLKSAIEQVIPDAPAGAVTFMDEGLHRTPRALADALQARLDAIPAPSLVLLGYGLCGNSLAGLRAGRHTLVVPRVHDCIGLLLGSREAYARECERAPGTYYLSPGWLAARTHPLAEYEQCQAELGSEAALWVMDEQYRHYQRLAFVASSAAEHAAHRAEARAVARFCERWGMRYEEIRGSTRYVARLREAASALEPADGDFILVPPGGELRMEQFLDEA